MTLHEPESGARTATPAEKRLELERLTGWSAHHHTDRRHAADRTENAA